MNLSLSLSLPFYPSPSFLSSLNPLYLCSPSRSLPSLPSRFPLLLLLLLLLPLDDGEWRPLPGPRIRPRGRRRPVRRTRRWRRRRSAEEAEAGRRQHPQYHIVRWEQRKTGRERENITVKECWKVWMLILKLSHSLRLLKISPKWWMAETSSTRVIVHHHEWCELT